MLKGLGCLIVFIASVMIGVLAGKTKSDRLRFLREMMYCLNVMESEIRFGHSALADVFEKIAKTCSEDLSKLFLSAVDIMQGHRSNASEAWNQAVDKISIYLPLTAEDKIIVSSLGGSLGELDIEGQTKNIRLVLEQLKQQEIVALEEKNKSEKLYRNLGTLCGAALIIVLY